MVTIKEIANALGVSPSTVSVVLGGKAAERKISPVTTQKVLDAAAQMGYQPNIAARSLRGGGGSDQLQIAVFWAQDFRASMMVRFLDGLRRAIMQVPQDIRLAVYPYVNDHLCDSQALTSSSDCHAAIICNASHADMDFLEQAQLAIPVVLYNRLSPRYCSVNVDDACMGALGARALSSQGCKRALVLSSPPAFSGMEVRVQGFVLEAQRHGMEVHQTRYCDNSPRGGHDVMERCLQYEWETAAAPDCVFCGSSMIALGALRALWEKGIPVPDQLRMVAIGNGMSENDHYAIPSLSVVHLPMEQMAAECLRLLLEVLAGTKQPPYCRILPVEYIPRESCGPLCDDVALPVKSLHTPL